MIPLYSAGITIIHIFCLIASVDANESNFMTIAVAGICVGVLVAFVIILISVLIAVYYIAIRHRRSRAAVLTAGEHAQITIILMQVF